MISESYTINGLNKNSPDFVYNIELRYAQTPNTEHGVRSCDSVPAKKSNVKSATNKWEPV